MENKSFDIGANKERLKGLQKLIIEAGLMKLKTHRSKGDWLDNSKKRNPNYLIAGLIHEVGELQKEVTENSGVSSVVGEIGDIFNYLIMILETYIIKDAGEEVGDE